MCNRSDVTRTPTRAPLASLYTEVSIDRAFPFQELPRVRRRARSPHTFGLRCAVGMVATRASAPHFDSYAAVADALRAGASGGHRLVVVAFIDRWAPPAYSTAAALEAVRASGDVTAFASVFIIDASVESTAAHEAGVLSTPALLFYWDGIQASVRRPAWEDDWKFSGAAPAERLVEMIRHARDCCVKQAQEGARLVVGLDF